MLQPDQPQLLYLPAAQVRQLEEAEFAAYEPGEHWTRQKVCGKGEREHGEVVRR